MLIPATTFFQSEAWREWCQGSPFTIEEHAITSSSSSLGANPRVSVVIPSRDGSDTIRRALDSLLGSAAHIAEVFVVFSNSPPAYRLECEALVDAYRPWFALHLLDSGVPSNGSIARNRGIDAATGEYVALLDDDDEWFPTKLDEYLATITKRELTGDFVLCSQVVVRFPGVDNAILSPERKYRGEPIADFILSNGGAAQTSALLLPTRLAKAVQFDPSLPRHQDYDFCMRLEAHGARFEFLNRPLSNWHQQGNSQQKGNTFDFCAKWLLENRARMSPTAYRGYIGKELLAISRATGRWKDLLKFCAVHVSVADRAIIVLQLALRAINKISRRAGIKSAAAARLIAKRSAGGGC